MVGTILGPALSALNAQSLRLAVSASNIANASTTGYKGNDVEFSANNGGVRAQVKPLISDSGLIYNTISQTDLAVSGDGFFITEGAGGQFEYTRNGNFKLDGNGDLANSSGNKLLGFALDNNGNVAAGTESLNNLEPISIDAATPGLASATSDVDVNLNLDANQAITGGVDFTANVTVFDSLGTQQDLTLEFSRTSVAPNEFELNITDSLGNNLIPTETLSFDGAGQLTSANTVSAANINFGNGSDLQDIDFDVSNITQYASGYTVSSVEQNGTGFGNFDDISIQPDGDVVARFDNGQERTLFNVPLANFSNADGLQRAGGNGFIATNDSGGPRLNSNSGVIQSSALESSNVNIDQEIVSSLQASQAYKASAAVIGIQNDLNEALLDAVSDDE